MGGDHHHTPEAMPRKEQDLELLKEKRIPLNNRDTCAHLLVPLEDCRRASYFAPWKCTNERHIYEECQYIAWLDRVKRKNDMIAAAAIADSK